MNDLRASSSTSSTGLLTEDDDMPLRPRKKQATTFTTTKNVYIKKTLKLQSFRLTIVLNFKSI